MSSPFKTADDYLNATGTLHSFTGHPALVGVTLAIGVAMLVYFLVTAFKTTRR